MGRMEGGTLTLRAYAQVENYFAYLSIIISQSVFLPVPENNLSTAAVITIMLAILIMYW